MDFTEGLDVAPTWVAPAKWAPRSASRHFITLHQIKSNKLITNDRGHASSKYRINIIDLILSMLSEKKKKNVSVPGPKSQLCFGGRLLQLGKFKDRMMFIQLSEAQWGQHCSDRHAQLNVKGETFDFRLWWCSYSEKHLNFVVFLLPWNDLCLFMFFSTVKVEAAQRKPGCFMHGTNVHRKSRGIRNDGENAKGLSSLFTNSWCSELRCAF